MRRINPIYCALRYEFLAVSHAEMSCIIRTCVGEVFSDVVYNMAKTISKGNLT